MYTDNEGQIHEQVFGIIDPVDIDYIATEKGYVSKNISYSPERKQIFHVYNKIKVFISGKNISINLVRDAKGEECNQYVFLGGEQVEWLRDILNEIDLGDE